MKAKDAIDGNLYIIPKISDEPVECHGPNGKNEWMLFLTFDNWGNRIIKMVTLETEITPL